MSTPPLLDLISSRAPRPTGRRVLTVTGLFAGIGGVELGLQRAGHHSELLCELDPGARAVLSVRFPEAKLHDDVVTLDSLPPGTDLLVAGFPCQDLSQAGRTAGISGARSGLVGEVFRLIETQRVDTVLLENVPFMLQLDRGAAMDLLVTEFERLGYRWAYRVVNTMAFGLPQRRRRVLFLASRELDPGEVLFFGDEEPEEPGSHDELACGFYWTEGVRGLGWTVDGIPTLKGGSGIGIPSPPAIWFPDGHIGTPDIRDAERLQGFPEGWTLPSNGVSRPTHRWKLVGNAVSVEVAAWIGERLANPTAPVLPRTSPLELGKSWPSAAFGDGSTRRAVVISEWPVRVQRAPLADFLTHPTRPLSARATAGFLARTRKGCLRFPRGFLPAMESHLAAVDRAAESNSSAA